MLLVADVRGRARGRRGPENLRIAGANVGSLPANFRHCKAWPVHAMFVTEARVSAQKVRKMDGELAAAGWKAVKTRFILAVL